MRAAAGRSRPYVTAEDIDGDDRLRMARGRYRWAASGCVSIQYLEKLEMTPCTGEQCFGLLRIMYNWLLILTSRKGYC